MKGRDEIESYLLKLGLPYEEIAEDTWMIQAGHGERNPVIKLAEPVAVFRSKVMDVPAENRERLFRTLLELNASDLVHGSYGLEGDTVVLSGALELENLDFNEFQATVEDILLALSNHSARLQVSV